MKVKILLKFYFNAATLNEWLDRLIFYNACKPEGGRSFEKIAALIEDKEKLCNLMNYIEGVFERLTEADKKTLEIYANLRIGIRNLKDAQRRETKRAVMKFTRKLTYIERRKDEVRVLQKYRAILNCPRSMP